MYAQVAAAAAVVIASLFACNTDSTDVLAPSRLIGPMAAVGIDPASGATIETSQDDYLPGELVRVTGHGWAANETVHFDMTEEPDTHGDVTADVQADSAGAFDVPFYDVQDHDLGVTFTLTATGQTSGSKAVAVFTDGNVSMKSGPAGVPTFTGTAVKFAQSASCEAASTGQTTNTGPVTTSSGPSAGLNANQSGSFTVPASIPGYAFSSWTIPSGVTVVGGSTSNPVGLCVNVGSSSTSGVLVANYVVANSPPILAAIDDKSVNEGSTFSFTASATDEDTPAQTLTYSVVGAPAGAAIDPTSGAFTWTPGDGPASATFTVKVTDNGSPALSDDETITVTVNNVDPTATFFNDAAVNEGSSFTLSLSGAFDPSAVDLATLQYAFDCGDGSGYGSLGSGTSTSCQTSDNGTRTVKGLVRDKDGGQMEYTASLTINNVAPTATFHAPSPVNEGTAIALALTNPVDPSSADASAGFQYAFDCGRGYGAYGSTSTASCLTSDNGTRGVKGKIKDKDGGESEYTTSVTINNVDPTASFNAPASVSEGTAISLSLTSPFDPSSADVAVGFSYAFDCGAGYGAYGNASSVSCPTTDDASLTAKGKIKDKDGGETEYTGSVTVTNVAPAINSLVVPLSPVDYTTPVTVTWSFTDPGSDEWTCAISWDTGQLPEAAFYVATKSCSASRTLSAGIYTVTVSVKDDDGGSEQKTATEYIVVYDPNGGFVTGGGWINSPAGAYTPDAGLSGKATFGFVSKYQKGATIPSGNTEFQFHAAGMDFKSTSYQWLVISGSLAQYKGEGTINGAGSYGFLLSAVDGQVNGGGGVDKFRIKIWDKATESVIYDNQIGAADDPTPATTIAGGSIVIHSK